MLRYGQRQKAKSINRIATAVRHSDIVFSIDDYFFNGRRFKSTRPATSEQQQMNVLSPAHFPRTTILKSSVAVEKTQLPEDVLQDFNADTAVNMKQHQLPKQVQPNSLEYTGGTKIPITSTLHIVTPEEDTPTGVWPIFRMMDEDGTFRDPDLDGKENAMSKKIDTSAMTTALCGTEFISRLQAAYPHYAETLEKMALFHSAKDGKFSYATYADEHEETATLPLLLRAHRLMVRLRQMDSILLSAQRQGRISFYLTCTGEEAIHMGAASALDLKDQVFTQYREQGVIMWRGFSLEQFTNQCFSNDLDLGKGRQMPIHYGSRALSFHTVSSPLGTQIPQASGAAYKLKLDSTKNNVAVCFFGDGCSSTSDFHSGLNFAATIKVPVLFICRNNGYAISTPVTDQYAGDGVVSHAPSYGMAGVRVDGNDIFALHAAVRDARAYALEHNAPVLVEAMTYRQGHHSTSDDSTQYRGTEEVDRFANNHDPLTRLEFFLMNHGWLSSNESKQIQESERSAVLQAMEKAEKRPPPKIANLFTDVYEELPPHLKEQQRDLEEHMALYPEHYTSTGLG